MLFYFYILACLFAAESFQSSGTEANELDATTSKIWGGSKVTESMYKNTYSYMAGVHGRAGFGSGFMIDSTWGLSARHVGVNTNTRITAGWNDSNTINRYPNYVCEHRDVDVVLFRLSQSWPYSVKLRAAGYKFDKTYSVGENVRAVGFGKTNVGGAVRDSDSLRTSTGTINQTRPLSGLEGRGTHLTISGVGTCPQDSGSPLVSRDGQSAYGVQSWITLACTNRDSRAAYIELTAIGEWLRTAIRGNGRCR